MCASTVTCSCDLKTAQTESSLPVGLPPYSSRTDQRVRGEWGVAGRKRDAKWENGSFGRLKICWAVRTEGIN